MPRELWAVDVDVAEDNPFGGIGWPDDNSPDDLAPEPACTSTHGHEPQSATSNRSMHIALQSTTDDTRIPDKNARKQMQRHTHTHTHTHTHKHTASLLHTSCGEPEDGSLPDPDAELDPIDGVERPWPRERERERERERKERER
jgi:hypothetical protein